MFDPMPAGVAMHCDGAEPSPSLQPQRAKAGVASSVAFASIVSNTGSSSPGELEMTLSTSEVAVCCCPDRSSAQLIEQPRVLDGDDGLRGEVLNQLDLLVGEWPHFLAVDDDCADQLIILEHRHGDKVRAPATIVAA